MKLIKVNSQRWLSIENFRNEIWKDIKGYGGFYEVSNIGRVRSKERVTSLQSYCHIIRKPRILKAQYNGNYYRVVLSFEGKSRQVLIHRLVAETFLPNPNELPEVNHKDENMLNNNLENLEWCTKQYNMSYGTKPMKQSLFMTQTKGRSVTQYQLDGTPIASYRTIAQASRKTGINATNILAVCLGSKQKTAGNFLWRYAEDEAPKTLDRCLTWPKAIKQYNAEGLLIASYVSLHQAAKSTGCSLYNIRKSLTTGVNSGFIWKYAN